MKEGNPFAKIFVGSSIGIILIAVIATYTNDSRKTVDKYATIAVQQSTLRISEEIDFILSSALNSIQLTSHIVSDGMTDKNFENAVEVLKKIKEKTPFAFIEYMPADSDSAVDGRDYYRDALKGKSGIWVNFKASPVSMNLVNFYAPLYYKNEIVGVLTGVLPSIEITKPLINSLFSNENTVGILCDSHCHIIGASFDLGEDLYMRALLEKYGVPLKGKENFLNNISSMDNAVFRFYARDGIGFGSVHSVPNSDWFVLQVLPAHLYKGVFHKAVYIQLSTIAVIIMLFVIHVFYVSFTSRKNKRKMEIENRRLLKEKSEEKERYYTIVQEALVKSEKYKNAVLADALTIFEANLTQNIIDYGKIRLKDNKTMSFEIALDEKFPCTYDLFVEKWAERFIKSTFRMDFLASINRQYLLNCAEIGKSEVSIETPAIDIYGKPVYVRRSIFLTTDENTGDVIAYGNSKDITSQKQKELMLANYEKILITTANDMYDGVVQVDLQNFTTIFHYFRNDRIVSEEQGPFEDFLEGRMQLVYPDDVPRVKQSINSEIFLSMPYDVSYKVNFRGIDKSEKGNQRVYTLTFSKTLIDHKPYALVVKVDITSAIENETEHRKIVEEALERAESANNAKSQFLSNMSHDIRTPMNAIVGFTNLAISHIDDKVKSKDYLEKISSASSHLLSLINDVLDMSYIESGKIHLVEQPLNVFNIVEDLKNILSEDVRKKELNFVVDTESVQNPDIMCDRLRLDQIMLNLLGNAVKFTNPGGSVELKVIELHDTNPVRYVFHVKDTGIGMSEEFIKHIFDPFERERTSTVSGIPGTGLGMSITKHLVEMMGGEITVTSKRNVGTEFVVTLPLRVTDSSGSQTENEVLADFEKFSSEYSEPFDPHGKRILLAEDNALNREIACAILGEAGFEVDDVEDGTYAIKKLQEKGAGYYTAVLMDIQMPIMNGYEASKQIREFDDKKLASVPIIAMTANAFEEDKEKALQAGMNAHIAKPVDVKILFETLRKVIH